MRLLHPRVSGPVPEGSNSASVPLAQAIGFAWQSAGDLGLQLTDLRAHDNPCRSITAIMAGTTASLIDWYRATRSSRGTFKTGASIGVNAAARELHRPSAMSYKLRQRQKLRLIGREDQRAGFFPRLPDSRPRTCHRSLAHPLP